MRQSLHVPFVGKLLGVVVMLTVLTLAGCGGGGSGSTGSGSDQPGKGVTVTIGSKNDPDGQLNAQMYALLLQNKGYTVNLKLALGQNAVLDTAIKNGAIDMYPEFTGTALGNPNYNLTATQDAHQAYQEVKDYYEKNFHITWLDPAYGLNDSYGLCTSQKVAQQYHLSSLADLAPVAGQLTLSGQQDFTDPKAGVFPPVAKTYGLNFKKTVQISESLGFDAVNKGDVDINECYTTDPAIVTENFVLLKDTKNAFPNYNPAPIVRDALLTKSPAIAGILNTLEPKLTTENITTLIKQYSVDHQPIKQVAQTFLQSQGLLPK